MDESHKERNGSSPFHCDLAYQDNHTPVREENKHIFSSVRQPGLGHTPLIFLVEHLLSTLLYVCSFSMGIVGFIVWFDYVPEKLYLLDFR